MAEDDQLRALFVHIDRDKDGVITIDDLHATVTAGSVVSVDIDNRYNTYAFDGKKKVILSTASWLGGKNDFLGIAYLVVGCLCYAYGLVFLVLLCKFPRELGDVSLLSWNKHNSKEV